MAKRKTGGVSRLKTTKKKPRKSKKVKISDMDELIEAMSQLFTDKDSRQNTKATGKKTRRKSNLQEKSDAIMRTVRKRKENVRMATRRSTRTRVASSRTQHGIAQSWESVRSKIMKDYTNRIIPENPTLHNIKTILAGEGITINITDDQLMQEYIKPLNIAITREWIDNDKNKDSTFKSFAYGMLKALGELDLE